MSSFNCFFLQAIETGQASVTAEYHCNKLIEVAKEIDFDKFVGVISDNCSTMQAMFTLLEKQYPTKFGNGCASHVLNLLVKDIAGQTAAKEIVASAVEVIKHINHHAKLKAAFDEARQKVQRVRSLCIPVPTRWHSLIEALRRLYAARHVISELFETIPKNWLTEEVIATVGLPSFWVDLNKLIKILEAPIALLTRFESDTCFIDEVYGGFLNLVRLYESETNQSDLIDNSTLASLTNDRWGFVNTEAHDYAFLLSPKNSQEFKNMPGTEMKDSVKRFKSYLGKYYTDKQQEEEAKKQFLTYLCEIQEELDEEYNVPPMQYWKIYGKSKYGLIEPIATRLLSMPASSAASERIWSVYGQVQTKYRGALSNEKVEKLVYCRVNHVLRENPRKIQHDKQESSDSDVEIVDSD